VRPRAGLKIAAAAGTTDPADKGKTGEVKSDDSSEPEVRVSLKVIIHKHMEVATCTLSRPPTPLPPPPPAKTEQQKTKSERNNHSRTTTAAANNSSYQQHQQRQQQQQGMFKKDENPKGPLSAPASRKTVWGPRAGVS
jgi:hypothetical protein